MKGFGTQIRPRGTAPASASWTDPLRALTSTLTTALALAIVTACGEGDVSPRVTGAPETPESLLSGLQAGKTALDPAFCALVDMVCKLKRFGDSEACLNLKRRCSLVSKDGGALPADGGIVADGNADPDQRLPDASPTEPDGQAPPRTSCAGGLQEAGATCDGGNTSPGDLPAPPLADAEPAAQNDVNGIYVSPKGSDSNTGSQSSPFKSIQKAASMVSAGRTVHVAPGSYGGGFSLSKSGSASARIRFISDQRWGAKLKGGISIRGSYVDFVGFEIDGRGTSYTGGIYVTGSYSTVQNCHVHHVATTIPCTSNGGAAIEADDWNGGRFIDFIGNVVHDSGAGCKFIQGLYHSTSGKILNNLVYNIPAVAIHLWHDACRIDIANNTVFNSGLGILVGGGDFYERANYCAAGADYVNVVNNIVYDNEDGIAEQGKTGPNNRFLNNLCHGNRSYNWSIRSSRSGDINASPKFVNYVRTGAGDYHLQPGSPGIDKGTQQHAPKRDLDGKARPLGGGFDVGAYER